MYKIEVALPVKQPQKYNILMGYDLLSSPLNWLPEGFQNLVVITDSHVQHFYGNQLAHTLKNLGFNATLIAFPPGEASKNHQTKYNIEEQMLSQGFGRDTLILALGGGVVGDLAGFIAATYMRGIPYVQLPTSLMAMVDSSIGGKTGIDTPSGKNLLGAFWQPLAIIADTTCLQTLPKTHLVNGLFEVIKIFLVADQSSFINLSNHLELVLDLDAEFILKMIKKAVALKVKVVEQDEKEQHIRAILNLGHTIGHALEALSHYQLLHGFAVGRGLLLESKIAQCMDLLSADDFDRVASCLKRLDIEPRDLCTYAIQDILDATQQDKKKKNGRVNYVLINGIGSTYHSENQFAHPVPESIVREAYAQLLEEV